MRSLVYATVSKVVSAANAEIMNRLSHNCDDDETMTTARNLIKRGYVHAPKVLDMFGGGGTISHEALNLGLDSYSIDSNELSVFIQKTNLQYLDGVDAKNLPDMVEKSGKRVLERLGRMTSPIFPKRKRPDGSETTNYLWTYAYKCEHCGGLFSLSKRRWLSKKNGKNLFIKIDETHGGPRFEVKRGSAPPRKTNWIKRSNKVECPHCGHEMSNVSIKKAKEILAVEVIKNSDGKLFQVAAPIDNKTTKKIREIEALSLRSLDADLPDSLLPKWSGIVNPALYGVETHADIFNPRQRATCLALLKSLKDEYDLMALQENKAIAKYITATLSGLVDQVVDWNCRMAMWIPQNEQVGRAFCGPGISMYWDFNETDPVASGPSNLNGKLNRIIKGVESIEKLPRKGRVVHAVAQKLPFEDNTFDAIVTDPPYYDNIFYTALADNFYSWKRLLTKHIEPKLFKNKNTDFDHELVASSKRNGERAHEEYCNNLKKAVGEASRVLKDDGVMSFVYSHSSLLGWEAVIEAFRHNRMVLTGVQPLSIERRQRPRAMKSEAVNICIAFVARNSKQPKRPINIIKLERQFRDVVDGEFANYLRRAGWHDEDIAMGLMAKGVAIVSNAKYIERTEDTAALLKLEHLIRKKCPKFRLSKRKSI